MNKYQAVVFDVDGTLLNTEMGILSAVEYTIERHGLTELSKDELKTFIGPPIQDSFQKYYGITDKSNLQEIATTFRNRYKDCDLLKAVPYEGIYELCNALLDKGISIAIATYKRQDYARKLLEHFGFDKYTKVIYGADHENKLKKVDIIKNCLEKMEIVDYKKAVMIGDSAYDAQGASLLGMDFIGVIYGFEFKTDKDVMKHDTSVGCAACAMDILKYMW